MYFLKEILFRRFLINLFSCLLFRFSLLSHHNFSGKVRDQDIGTYSKVIRISSSVMAKNPTLAGPVITGTLFDIF